MSKSAKRQINLFKTKRRADYPKFLETIQQLEQYPVDPRLPEYKYDQNFEMQQHIINSLTPEEYNDLLYFKREYLSYEEYIECVKLGKIPKNYDNSGA